MCELWVLLEHGPDVLKRLHALCLPEESQPLGCVPRRSRCETHASPTSTSPPSNTRGRPGSDRLPLTFSWLFWSSCWVIIRIHKLSPLIRVDHERGRDGELVAILSAIPHFVKVVFFPLAKDNIICVFHVICKSAPRSLQSEYL